MAVEEFEYANASVVTPQLWVGGDLTTHHESQAERQLAEMVDAGLTHILDARLEWNDAEFVAARAPAVRYLHLGVDDAGQRMPDEWFDQGTRFVLEAMADPDARVLVHCHMGINRGPSMGFAVLLATGWSPVAAHIAIHRVRPIAWIDYWADATRWWARRAGTPERELRNQLEQAQQWRDRLGIGWRATYRGIR